MKGGKPFALFLDEESFVQQYPGMAGTTSIEKLLTLYPIYDHSTPINVLVGCGNMNDNDWSRFNSSETYSIYIDSKTNEEEIESSSLLDVRRQYKMFTVFFEEINIDLMPENAVTHYHFDLMVAYFCDRNAYMKLFDRTLRPGGFVVFNRTEHHSFLQFFSVENSSIKLLDQYLQPLAADSRVRSMLKYFSFDIANKRVTLKDESSDEYFLLYSKLLSAESGFKFMEVKRSVSGLSMEPYVSDVSDAYAKFLVTTHGSKYDIIRKSFNYQNYSYPVPLQVRTSESYNRGKYVEIWNSPCAKFIVNTVMTDIEFNNYVQYGRIDQHLINALLDKVLSSAELKQEYVGQVAPKSEEFREDEFIGMFYAEILKDYEYYEFIKR